MVLVFFEILFLQVQYTYTGGISELTRVDDCFLRIRCKLSWILNHMDLGLHFFYVTLDSFYLFFLLGLHHIYASLRENGFPDLQVRQKPKRGKGEEDDASSPKLNLTDPSAYSTMPVQLLRDARPKDWVTYCSTSTVYARVQCREPKTWQKKVQLYCKDDWL